MRYLIRKTALCLGMFMFWLVSYSCSAQPRILVFAKTRGFRHSSIPAGKAAILQLGKIYGFAVDTTENAGVFVPTQLKQYAAVVFLNTTGDVLDDAQQSAFEGYIRAGGGYVGVHAASDTEYGWPWYGKLAGAYFDSHPAQQEAVLRVTDRGHVSTRHLPAVWKRKDEWYNFKDIQKHIKPLLVLDENSYNGGKNTNYHPAAWYHAYDGGRAWYTALGHTEASYTEDYFLKHLLGGIRYAMGIKTEE